VIDIDGVFFVWCGTYICTKRRASGQRPYHFNSYDAGSLKYLPDVSARSVECRRQWQTIEMSLEGTQPRTAFDFNGDLYRFGARQRFPSTPWLIERWCVSNS